MKMLQRERIVLTCLCTQIPVHFLVVFSYYYISNDQNAVKPKLTAYISDKKVITCKFPGEAVGVLCIDLMCVQECAEDSEMIMEDVEFKTVAFLDQPLPSFSAVSSLFTLHDKDFQIDLPRENQTVNNYSLALYGVVMFASKILTGKLMARNFSLFKELGMKLEKAVGTKDVSTFRQAICEVLYVASLTMVHLKGANLLTDAYWNH